MADIWTFGPAIDSTQTYADGTTVPHRVQLLRLNGVAVGEIEIHAHKRRGPDGITDISYGITAISYGPPTKGT